jgi:phage terminase small subunit
MLNEAQQKFVEATLRGAGPKAAAIAAGLSENTAASAGSRMRKHPKIVAALAAIGFATPGLPAEPAASKKAQIAESPAEQEEVADIGLPQTEDSLEFLEAVVANPNIPLGRRLEAAKTLLPFQHAKIGEKGKKATKAEGAASAAAEGNKFGARPAPLRAVPK